MSDGKDLEELIAFVERALVPEGGTVETRKRVFMESGVQEVEFDVTVRGKLGSADMSLLLECRDRPSQGAAPAAWIRELHGKRQQYRLHKVIAVSTTGFSEPAVKAASDLDVELRTVKRLDIDAFRGWLLMTHFVVGRREAHLSKAKMLVSQHEPPNVQDAVREVLRNATGESKILKAIKSGETSVAKHAFLAIVEQNDLFARVEPNGPDLNVGILAEYVNDEDHFVIETALGDVRVMAIEFEGALRINQVSVPLEQLLEYRNADGSPISQVAIFAPHPILGMLSRMEIHRLPESGTHVLMRTEGPAEADADASKTTSE
jgi:hypothetical protein